MIIKISWRNIWRNKVRSIVVILAVALGLWAGIFATAFVQGMMVQKIDSIIRMEMSHFQIHHKKFRDKNLPVFVIDRGEEILEEIALEETVVAATGRLIAFGSVESTRARGQLKMNGIDTLSEQMVTGLAKYITEGSFLGSTKSKPIIISEEIAEEYQVKLRSKLIFNVLDANNDQNKGGFRVVGIYKTGNNMYDKMNVFVLRDDLADLLSIEKGYHEIAVLLNNHDLAESLADKYSRLYPELEVLPWMDLASGMRYMLEAFDVYLYYIVGIILFALLFSILNTMLMAVLERIREIGMLVALGMARKKVYAMIMLETIFLTLIGGPLGLFLSWLSVTYFGTTGIDMSGAAYDDLGFATVIYPVMELKSYVNVTLMVVVMAILAALYPARKAIKLKPLEAIRKI